MFGVQPRFQLLFRGTRHTFDQEVMFPLLSGKNMMLWLLQTSNNTGYGGFIMTELDGIDQFNNSNDCAVFSLKENIVFMKAV